MANSGISSISVKDLAALWKNNPNLAVIDVCTAGEYESAHVEGAKSHPLHNLSPSSVLAESGSADTPIYILCKSGIRATKAADTLLQGGVKNPVIVTGGNTAWIAAGLPVKRGERNVLPLDRQMRATAGLFIFLGALLGLTVNASFLWIPLFMGLGLTFSGITGICPLSNVIAKMPWNRGSNCCCSSN